MASIKKYNTAKGTRWRVDYVKPDGKNTSKRGFLRKTDAQNWAAANTVGISTGDWVSEADKRRPLESFWNSWWASKQILAPGSTSVMERSWRLHVKPQWGHYQVGRITRTEVQAWLAKNSIALHQ